MGTPGVFLDIMPQLDMVGLQAVTGKITKVFTDMGRDLGALVGKAGMTPALQNAVKDYEAAGNAATAAAAKAKSAADSQLLAEQKLAAAKAKTIEMTEKYGASSARALSAQAAETKATQDLTAAEIAATRATEGLTAAQAKAATASEAHTAAQATAAATATKATAAFNTLGKGAVVGLGIAMATTTKSAVDFESSQARLVASAGVGKDQLKGLSDGILKMTGDVGYSAQQLSEGMYGIASAGYRSKDGLTVLKAAAEGAKAENADLHEVVNGLTTSIHDFGYKAEDASAVMSKMVVAVGNSKTNFQGFAGALHSVEPAAAGAHIKLEDVYGVLAQMTQTGMSADQAAQNMANAIRSMQNPTAVSTAAMEKFGISAQDVSLHLGDRGLAGTMQLISDKIRSQMNPQQQIVIDTMYKNAQATKDATAMFEKMPPAVQAVAKAVQDGTLTAAQYRKTSGGLSVEQKSQVDSWITLQKKITGYSGELKAGKGTVDTYAQALQQSTGTANALQVALSVTGEHAEGTNALIKQLGETTSEAGGHTKGYAEVQETAKAKLDNFKSAVGAAKIQIGDAFLPVLTDLAHLMTPLAKVFSDNEWAAKGLIGTLALVGGAWAVWKVGTAVTEGATLALAGLRAGYQLLVPAQAEATAAQTALDVAMDANPIGAVVAAVTAVIAAITLLAVGVKYAYDHFKWFHDAVDSVWQFLKKIGTWLGHEFMEAWNGIGAILSKVGGWFAEMGRAAMDLYHKYVEPAFSMIFRILKDVATFVTVVVIAPWVIAFKVLGAIFHWLWESSVKPVLGLIGDLFKWVYDSVIKVVVGFITMQIEAFSAIMHWLYDNAVKPVMDLIGAIWNWIYDNVIKLIVIKIKNDIEVWGKVFSWLYDHVIKPVGEKIGDALHGVKDFFKDCVDWVETQWNRLKKATAGPVKFVIENVYNKGIVPLWNDVAGVFGADKIKTVDTNTLNYAGGGVVQDGTGVLVPEAARALGVSPSFPGYAPGVDSIPAVSSSGKKLMFSPGEALVDTDQFGGAAGLWAVNHHYSGGRENANGARPGTHFGPGGVVGDIIGGVEHTVSGAIDTAKTLAKFATDPIKAVKDYFSKWIGQVLPGDASAFKDAITKAPGLTVDKIADWVKSWFGSHPGAGKSVGNVSWVSGAGAEQWEPVIIQALQLEGFPTTPEYVNAAKAQIMTESGGNPNISQGVQDVNSGGNEAQGLVQVTPGTARGLGLADLGGNIHDPLTNLRLGLREIKSQHGGDLLGWWGHGHGYAGGGVTGREDSATVSADEIARMGGGTVNLSILEAIRAMDPKVKLTAGKTDHIVDGGFHPKGEAVDLSNDAIEYAWSIRDQLAQIITTDKSRLWYNVHGEKATGQQAFNIYGADTVAEHGDHVHVAALQAVHALTAGATGTGGGYSSGGSNSGGASSTSGGSASAGSTGGGTSSSGGSGGSSTGELLDIGNPSNWSLKGLATYGAQIAANALLGNPLGKLKAQQANTSATGASATAATQTTATNALTTATTAATTANDAAAKAQDTAATTTAKATGTAQTAAEKAQTALQKAQDAYKKSLDSLAKHKTAYATAVAKHGANSKQAVTALAATNKEQGVVDRRKQKLTDLGGDPNNLDAKPTASTTAGGTTTTANGATTPGSAATTQPGGTPVPTSDISTQPTQSSGSGSGIDPQFAGGLIGTAIAAGGSGGANPLSAAGVASSLSQTGLQLASRAVSYAGQVGGILADGVLETFGLTDPSQTLPGKVLTSLAGAHPVTPNTAGSGGSNGKPVSQITTQQTNQQNGSGKQAPVVNIENQNVHNGDGTAAGRDIVRQVNGKVGSNTR